TLTIGLDGTAADGGVVGPVCTGFANQVVSQTVVCESGPTACTTAPCAPSGPNSVQCPGGVMGDGSCTPTEAILVEHDIAAGHLTGGQLTPYVGTSTVPSQGSCYGCLMGKECNQTASGPLQPVECEQAPDLTGQLGGVPGVPGQGPALCRDVLECVLGTDCQGPGGIAGTTTLPAQENVNLCVCGGNHPGSGCGSNNSFDGLCFAEELRGSGFSKGGLLLANLTFSAIPSGVANYMLECAIENHCSICVDE
ncbi:MAG: hypothetical protein ACRENE_19320, partial [Polyangiaceae bacterium]